MSRPTFAITLCKLPNDEGGISVVTEIEPRNEGFILKHTLRSFILIHEGDDEHGVEPRCGGHFEDVVVSSSKRVLVCNKCSLRVSIPITIISLGNLKQAFS